MTNEWLVPIPHTLVCSGCRAVYDERAKHECAGSGPTLAVAQRLGRRASI